MKLGVTSYLYETSPVYHFYISFRGIKKEYELYTKRYGLQLTKTKISYKNCKQFIEEKMNDCEHIPIISVSPIFSFICKMEKHLDYIDFI